MSIEALRQDYMRDHDAYWNAVRDSKPIDEIESLRLKAVEKKIALTKALVGPTTENQ